MFLSLIEYYRFIIVRYEIGIERQELQLAGVYM